MKVVVLCGGLGTRLREETEFRPKPLVEIAWKPILWHIRKIYAHCSQRSVEAGCAFDSMGIASGKAGFWAGHHVLATGATGIVVS